MADDTARRMAAMRSCRRILSGVRPATMREQLATLAAGYDLDGFPDRYGDGPVTVLEERVAALLGTEAAVYLPTGTMAQQIALRFWAGQTGSRVVAMHPLGHLEVHERHAYAVLGGLSAVWSTTARRPPTAAEVADLDEPFGTLLLELPLRDAGFVLPSWDELVAVVDAARDRGARVHLDGARLWESTPHLGRPLPTVAGLADSVYVSFYKSLGALAGAALAGPAELAGPARAWRHRYGGQLFQQWPAVVAALAGLDTELPRLPGYVAQARVVAGALAGVPGCRVHPAPPHTHQFQLWLPYPAARLNEAALALAEEEGLWFVAGWRDSAAPGRAYAEVTVAAAALGWPADEVVGAARRFLDRVARSTG